jgi:hypothetical protein
VVIFGSLLLIFAAIGLAVLGVVSESNAMLVGSIAASLLAAIGLVVGARQSASALPAEDGAVPSSQPPAERLAPVGVGAAAATGTVYTANSGAGSVGATSPAPAGAAQSLPDTLASGANPPPTGTIPAQAGPSAFPPGDAAAEHSAGDPPSGEPPVGEPPLGEPPVGAVPAPDGVAYDIYGVAVDADSSADAPVAGASQGSGGAQAAEGDVDDPPGEPAVEPATRAERERAAQLDAEVVVIDGHPRYHLADCLHLKARDGVESLPVSEAEELGFSPCSACAPLRTLLSD